MYIINYLIGIAMIIGGIILEITWLGICFGSVVLGIVLLIFAPHILFLPYRIGVIGGLLFIANANMQREEGKHSPDFD